MPPKKTQENLILMINIGRTTRDSESNPSLLEQAKIIAQRIIEKKIFLCPKDEIAIILMGSSVTKNSLNTEHVSEYEGFQIPNWDLVEKITRLQSTQYCSNWIEALVSAVDFMKENVVNSSTKKIVLMSDFNEGDDIVSQFTPDFIAKLLRKEGIQLMTIGEESLTERRQSPLKVSEKLLQNVYKQIHHGQHTTYDDAISDLRYYIEPPKTPFPWYCNLQFFDKNISIASYVKVKEEKCKPWKRLVSGKEVKAVTQYADRQRNTYNEEQILTGYKYGGVFIPVEKELEESMRYKSGMKCYQIHSFTKRDNVDLEHWSRGSVRIVLPSPKDPNAVKPFYSLVQAMHEESMVAIVRKVYRENITPHMVALFPCIDVPNEPWCLVEIPLAYAEDWRLIRAQPLKSVFKQLTPEQDEAIDNLLDSLMLFDDEDSHAVDGARHFLPGCVPNPAVQHRWHMFSHRAMNPEKPLPPMEDYLKEQFEAPLIKKRSEKDLKLVAELFQMESIVPESKKSGEREQDDSVQNDYPKDTGKPNKVEIKTATSDNENKLPLERFLYSEIDMDELAANT